MKCFTENCQTWIGQKKKKKRRTKQNRVPYIILFFIFPFPSYFFPLFLMVIFPLFLFYLYRFDTKWKLEFFCRRFLFWNGDLSTNQYRITRMLLPLIEFLYSVDFRNVWQTFQINFKCNTFCRMHTISQIFYFLHVLLVPTRISCFNENWKASFFA